MNDRTKAILETSVRDFIKKGKPVTSESLYCGHDFGIKPAMIRWELNDLGEAGYLSQVHPSGGRVPANKAYRFFVDNLLEEEFGDDEVWRGMYDLTNKFLRGQRKPFIEEVADYLRLVSVGYEPERVQLYESGLDTLLGRLEIEEKDDLVNVVRDIESLEERLGDFELEEGGPQVFIGQNPLIRSECLSLIAEQFDVYNQSFFLLAIGPKRMDYRKSLRLFRSLEKSFGK